MYASTHADVPMSPEARKAELAKLYKAVDLFSEQMVRHLEAKLDAGWRGWDDPANANEIYSAMLAHGAGVPLAVGQEVGIANFALFLWYQRQVKAGAMEGLLQRYESCKGYAEGVERDRAAGIYRDTVPVDSAVADHPVRAAGSDREALIDRLGTPPVDIKRMVDRFLSWPLPKGFAPDCGITFDGAGMDPEAYKDGAGYRRSWPVGTNLFTAPQAREMFEHALADPGTTVAYQEPVTLWPREAAAQGIFPAEGHQSGMPANLADAIVTGSDALIRSEQVQQQYQQHGQPGSLEQAD